MTRCAPSPHRSGASGTRPYWSCLRGGCIAIPGHESTVACKATFKRMAEQRCRDGACLQVNMLLTLEEFCGEEGIFEGTGEHGHLFEPMFGQVSTAT